MAIALAYAAYEAFFWGVVEPTVVYLSTSEGAYIAATTTAGVLSAVHSAGTGLGPGRHLDDATVEDEDCVPDPGPDGEIVTPDPGHNSDQSQFIDHPTHTSYKEMQKIANQEYRTIKHMLLRHRHHVFGPVAVATIYKFVMRFWRFLGQRERAQSLRIMDRTMTDYQFRHVQNIVKSLVDAGKVSTPARRARDFMDPWSTPKRRRH